LDDGRRTRYNAALLACVFAFWAKPVLSTEIIPKHRRICKTIGHRNLPSAIRLAYPMMIFDGFSLFGSFLNQPIQLHQVYEHPQEKNKN
jgi:hypothetical protein